MTEQSGPKQRRDVPDGGVPIAVAVSGDKSIARLAPLGDHLITTEPEDVALVQVGDENQQRSLDEAAGPLLESCGRDGSG